MKQKNIILIFVLLSIYMLSGCSNNDTQKTNIDVDNNKVVIEEVEDKIIDNGEEILSNYYLVIEGDDFSEIITYVDNNIALLSKEDASIMVQKLEEQHKKYLEVFAQKYLPSEIGAKLIEENKFGDEFNDVSNIKDDILRSLIDETIKNGFKVETTEGFYFPIIDYSFYNKYMGYVTDDIVEYIGIMTEESNVAVAKDAGLVISWDQAIERMLRQEKYIRTYIDSDKLYDVKQLYKRYVYYVFYGLDNTPIADYSTNVLNEEIKSAYQKAVASHEDSNFRGKMEAILELYEKNNNIKTKEVEQITSEVVAELIKTVVGDNY